jgi:molecular chaperone GrpE
MMLNDKEAPKDTTVDEIQQALADEKQRHMRTLADFENYRKRVERDAAAQYLRSRKEILLDLLTFLDYFDQARAQVHDPATAEGLEIIRRQLDLFMQKQGVRQVDCLGQIFDPVEHEGLGYIENEAYRDGCVAGVVSPGYLLDDLLLRPAKVMVVKSSDPT